MAGGELWRPVENWLNLWGFFVYLMETDVCFVIVFDGCGFVKSKKEWHRIFLVKQNQLVLMVFFFSTVKQGGGNIQTQEKKSRERRLFQQDVDRSMRVSMHA